MPYVTASYGATYRSTRHFMSPPNFHRLYVLSIHTFEYDHMADATTSYGRFTDLISSLEVLMVDTLFLIKLL